MAYIRQPTKDSVIDFDVDEFAAGLQVALKARKKNYALGLEMLAARVVRAAKQYSAVDTGRQKSGTVQWPVVQEAGKLYVEVGITMETLEAAATTAGEEVYAKIKAGGRVPKSGKAKQTARRAETPTTFYPFFQEFGTSKSPAHPFMRPALAEVAGYIGPTISGPRKANV